MKDELAKLGPDGFERLIQSLLGSETYGDGPDGQREAVIQEAKTLAALPNLKVSGYLVAQVKFKSPEGGQKDRDFVLRNLKEELDAFRKKAAENEVWQREGKTEGLHRLPDTWLFITNLVLSPVEFKGLKDRADELAKTARGTLIPLIYILGADDVQTMLHNRPIVAAGFPALYQEGLRSRRDLLYYVACRFRDQSAVRLEQAGSVTERRVDLRKVYTDLTVTGKTVKKPRSFTALAVALGDKLSASMESLHRIIPNSAKSILYNNFLKNEMQGTRLSPAGSRLALLGEAGQGKSTVCQLLCQIHRAALLRRRTEAPAEALEYLRPEGDAEPLPLPKVPRIPMMISLKDYAAWIGSRGEAPASLLLYLLEKINNRAGTRLTGPELRELLEQEPWLFCFDGLDEVPASSNRSSVLSELLSFLYQELEEKADALCILTSRPQGYDNTLLPQFFETLRLQPLDPERCLGYLDRLLPYLVDDPEERDNKLQLMRGALEDPTTAKLMEVPLYATILLLVARTGGGLPTRRYDLFREYCITITNREKQKGLLPDLEKTYHWVLQTHRELGLLLQRESDTRENAAAQLDLARLQSLLLAYLERNEYEGDPEAKAAALLEAMTQRLPFLTLTTDSAGAACVLFPLRSIQEYYAAEGIIALPDENRISKTLDAISRSAYWRNVFLFAAGCYTADPEHYRNLNDQLYIICRRNNGDPDYGEDAALTEACSLTHSGAWLALDLLCDGIFARAKDKTRYCALLRPLLELHGLEGAWLDRFRRLSEDLSLRLMEKVLLPELTGSLDGDSLALALLWDMANQELPGAAGALEELLPRLRVLYPESCNRLLSLGWGKLPDSVVRWLFARITVDFFCDFSQAGNDGNYLLFLEDCCRRFGWQELPVPAVRQALYLMWGSAPVLWMDASHLSFTDPLQNAAWDAGIYRAFFAAAKSSHGLLWFRPLVAERGSDRLDAEDYEAQLAARGLEELRALLSFQRFPTAAGLNEIASAWAGLDPQTQTAYGALLRHASWVLDRLADALEAGQGIDALLPRGDQSWAELLAQDRDLRDLAESEDLLAIQARDGWDQRIRVYSYINDYYSIDKMNLNALLRASQGKPLRVEYLRLLRFAANRLCFNVLLPALTDFIRMRGSAMDGQTVGDYFLLRLFDETDRNKLLLMDFPYPRTPKNSYHGNNFLTRLANHVLEKLCFLTRQTGVRPEAWSLFHAVLPHVQSASALPAPVTAAELEEIRATGNQAALFGGVLSRLMGPLTQPEQTALAPDLDRFLTEELLDYFSRAGDYFSRDGKLLILRRAFAAMQSGDPETAEDVTKLVQSCTYALLGDLQGTPVT